VRAGGYDAYSLLAAIGRDCGVALQFLPDGVDPGAAGGIAGRPLEDKGIHHHRHGGHRQRHDDDHQSAASSAAATPTTTLSFL
jgi:hypothetical protein